MNITNISNLNAFPPAGNYPLVEPQTLKLFEEDLAADAVYNGANAEKISTAQGEILLPRSLYHFLFIYCTLKHKKDGESYDILKRSIGLVDGRAVSNLKDWPRPNIHHEKLLTNIRSSTETFHEEVYQFFSEKELTETMTWGQFNQLFETLWSEIETFLEPLKVLEENSSDDTGDALVYSFYRFCFSADAKNQLLRSLALEWSAPNHYEVLYRCGDLSRDDLRRQNLPQSLSFGTSFYSGIVFEGTPNGTCAPIFYHQFSTFQELYALKVKVSKIEKYFFYPRPFRENGLIPLVARGEFSHPRLRTFINEGDRVAGVAGNQEIPKLVASFDSTIKIPTLENLRVKIRKIYNSGLFILGTAKSRPIH